MLGVAVAKSSGPLQCFRARMTHAHAGIDYNRQQVYRVANYSAHLSVIGCQWPRACEQLSGYRTSVCTMRSVALPVASAQ